MVAKFQVLGQNEKKTLLLAYKEFLDEGEMHILRGYLSIMSPKNNLEANLKNHITGKKHANVMEALDKNSKVQVHYELEKKGDRCRQK
jgi:hypothetical protein